MKQQDKAKIRKEVNRGMTIVTKQIVCEPHIENGDFADHTVCLTRIRDFIVSIGNDYILNIKEQKIIFEREQLKRENKKTGMEYLVNSKP